MQVYRCVKLEKGDALLSAADITFWIASDLLQPLGGERVVPALHVLSGEFVLAKDSHCLAFSAASDRLDHFVKVAFVAFILRDTKGNKC